MDGLFPEPLLLVDSLLLLEGLEVLDVDVEEEEELLAAAGDEFLEVSLVLEDEFDILVFVRVADEPSPFVISRLLFLIYLVYFMNSSLARLGRLS